MSCMTRHGKHSTGLGIRTLAKTNAHAHVLSCSLCATVMMIEKMPTLHAEPLCRAKTTPLTGADKCPARALWKAHGGIHDHHMQLRGWTSILFDLSLKKRAATQISPQFHKKLKDSSFPARKLPSASPVCLTSRLRGSAVRAASKASAARA